MKKILILVLPALVLVSCAQQQLAKADKDHARMAYARAVQGYEKALPKTNDRDAALRAADAYQRMNMNAKAAQWYAFANGLQPLAPDDALRYAQVLQGLDRSEEALRQYDGVLAERPEDAMVLELRKATAERNDFFVDTTLFAVAPVELEGMVSAFAAAPCGNGIVFAGEKAAASEKQNPWNGNSFLDLYSSEPSGNGTWGLPQALPGTVNGRFHDGPAAFSADARTMYFTRSDYYKFRLNKDGSAVSHLKLFRASKDEQGNWSDIRQFAYNGDDHSTGHAALSADGGTLYLISDMPGGFGGTDIYRCLRTEDGWSEPVNLGPQVNTAGNEMFPTLHGDSLFFASNGHGGMGGLDLFVTAPIDGAWSSPENLNYPINTIHDDFAFVLLPDGESGFLSSNRSGSDRVFSFSKREPTLLVQGTVTDDEHYLPMAEVEMKLLDLNSGEILSLTTGPDGSFAFDLAKGRNYRLSGEKNGMFTESRELSTMGQRTSRTWTEAFKLQEVVVDKPMLVENIYYDYDRWDIREEAAAELNKVARIFMDNPNMSFELSSHTDSRASNMYNLMLSEARAKSAVDYLIRKGVNPERITAKGYGESQLVNSCRDGVECSEEEHQANRRTEFRVTKISSMNP